MKLTASVINGDFDYEQNFPIEGQPEGLTLVMRPMAPHQRASIIDLDKFDAMQARAFEACIVGWKEVYNGDGKAVEFSMKLLCNILTEHGRLWRIILDHILDKNAVTEKKAGQQSADFTAPPAASLQASTNIMS